MLLIILPNIFNKKTASINLILIANFRPMVSPDPTPKTLVTLLTINKVQRMFLKIRYLTTIWRTAMWRVNSARELLNIIRIILCSLSKWNIGKARVHISNKIMKKRHLYKKKSWTKLIVHLEHTIVNTLETRFFYKTGFTVLMPVSTLLYNQSLKWLMMNTSAVLSKIRPSFSLWHLRFDNCLVSIR